MSANHKHDENGERRSPERSTILGGCEPEVVVHYRDPVTQAMGYAVIDTLATGVAYANVRVKAGTRWQDSAPVARMATIRYQLARVPLGGARIALDYRHDASDMAEVLGRFLLRLRPYLSMALSLGPDVNVPPELLDGVLARNNLPWRMAATQQVQGWPMSQWEIYQKSLATMVGDASLRERQVAHAAAHSVVACTERLLGRKPTVTVIGTGEFANATIRELAAIGAEVVGFGGESAGMISHRGLSPEQIQKGARAANTAEPAVVYATLPELYALPVDVLVLATNVDAITVDNVGLVRARIVVELTPHAVTRSAEKVLTARRVWVLPSFAAMMGGVLVADALLRQAVADPVEALEFSGLEARTMVDQLVRLAHTLRVPLREAGIRLAFHRWNAPPPGVLTPDPPIEWVDDEPPEIHG